MNNKKKGMKENTGKKLYTRTHTCKMRLSVKCDVDTAHCATVHLVAAVELAKRLGPCAPVVLLQEPCILLYGFWQCRETGG